MVSQVYTLTWFGEIAAGLCLIDGHWNDRKLFYFRKSYLPNLINWRTPSLWLFPHIYSAFIWYSELLLCSPPIWVAAPSCWWCCNQVVLKLCIGVPICGCFIFWLCFKMDELNTGSLVEAHNDHLFLTVGNLGENLRCFLCFVFMFVLLFFFGIVEKIPCLSWIITSS